MILRGACDAESRTIRIFADCVSLSPPLRHEPTAGPAVLIDRDTVVAGGVRSICAHLAPDHPAVRGAPRVQPRWLGAAEEAIAVEEVEAAVARSAFLCGDTMTLADIWVSVCVSSRHYSRDPDSGFPRTLSWIERVKALCPAWTPVQYEVVAAGAAFVPPPLAEAAHAEPSRTTRHEQEAVRAAARIAPAAGCGA